MPEKFTIMKQQRQQKSYIMLALAVSNSRRYCLSSRAIQILIRSVRHQTKDLQISLGKKKKNGEK